MEKIFDINDAGCSIRCKLYSHDPGGAPRVVVFGHGFGGHKDNKAAERFAHRVLTKYKDAAVLTFDWPCHGDDVRKSLSLDDCDTYLGLVLAHARERLGAQELYGYATSFGGYLFLKYIAAHGDPFLKLALRCPAINMHGVLTDTIISQGDAKSLMRGKPVLAGFDRKVKITRQLLDELQAADIRQYDYSANASDILILHGTGDEVVPFEDSRAFAERNGVEFIPVEDADHRFIDPKKMELAMEYILAFYEW